MRCPRCGGVLMTGGLDAELECVQCSYQVVSAAEREALRKLVLAEAELPVRRRTNWG